MSSHKPHENKEIKMPELKKFKKEQTHKKHILLLNKIKSVPKKYLIPAVALGALAAGLLAFYLFRGSDPVPVAQVREPEIVEEQPVEEAPELIASPLSGVLVTKQQSQRPVTGVMIENSLNARPQSGLQDAGVVFEAIAEGGVTRFLVLYQENAPNYFGPVRSSRPYFVEWLAPFDAGYVHVGGDIAGRAAIASYIDKDLDQYNYGSSYTRISSRSAPHNVYTGFDRIDALNTDQSDFVSWPRKDDTPLDVPTAANIKLSISSSSFNPSYIYDQPTNTYKRSMGSSAHVDQQTDGQLAPKVVIGIQVSNSTYLAKDGGRTRYQTVGSGKAWIFQDGQVTVGKWQKDSPTAQLKFIDSGGVEVKLNRGQTWISAVKGASW